MARINVNDIDNYSSGNGVSRFFGLKNDGDTAQVRFMYNGMDDIEACAVHEVTDENGNKRYVNCLRSYDEPLDNCPFCKEHRFQAIKLFIPLYDVNNDKVRVWERGKTYVKKLSAIASRYGRNGNLVNHIFEIERQGASGDTKTSYEIFEIGNDNTELSDLPEIPNIIGDFVLDWTSEDMWNYLDNGGFPAKKTETTGVRRREQTSSDNNANIRSGRRTPANSGNGRDRF